VGRHGTWLSGGYRDLTTNAADRPLIRSFAHHRRQTIPVQIRAISAALSGSGNSARISLMGRNI
jgi:hypothetical protein